MHRIPRIMAFILCAAAPAHAIIPGLPGLGLPGVGPAPSHVQSRILADTTAVGAGMPFTLAIELTTHPDWHVYWSNPGEGGIATVFEWKLPEGFKVEPLAMPLPMKFVQPGNIIGYGYSGPTAFLFKVTPPAALPEGGRSVFAASVSWLVCDDKQCVPGNAKLELSLPNSTGIAASANQAFFAAAQEKLPAPKAPQIRLQEPKVERISPARSKWTLPLTFAEAPVKVEAFPDQVDGLDISDIQIEMDKYNVTISLHGRILGGQTLKTRRAPILIAYTLANGKRQGFFVELDLGGLGARPDP